MKTILIRAEDKNKWEARTPLTPVDVAQLIKGNDIEVQVENSNKRFFKSEEYKESGAHIVDSMSGGDIIFGVKEIPLKKLIDNKIYLFFSHTIKGQKSNMPMLKRIMDGGSTLIDYERIADAEDRRLVYFGPFAGDAGAIDILWLMGEYWQNKGLITPFSEWKQATHYHSVEDAKNQLKIIGNQIRKEGLPEEINPCVIGILGYGNVSSGAQNIINSLPVEYVKPGDLQNLHQEGNHSSNTIYVCVFKEEDMVVKKNDGDFNLQEYYSQPDQYRSCFDLYLPYITILINATYWDKRYPKFVTWENLEELFKNEQMPQLQGIADITCDVNGSIGCNVKTTDTGMPAYRCFPLTRTTEDGHLGEGVVLLAVDNLPAEIPNDSSAFFSNQLKQFVPGIVNADYQVSLEESGLPEEVRRAVVVYNGHLTQDYKYLEKFF